MVSEGIKNKIEQWFDKDYRLTFYERIQYLIESEPLFEELSYAPRYGKTLEYILKNISVFIQPEEKLIGSVKEVLPTDEEYKIGAALTDNWWNIPLEEVQEKISWFYSYGWLKRRAPWFYSFGHIGLLWEDMLTKGLGEFKQKAEISLQQIKETDDMSKTEFLEGAIICYDAISQFILRYAECVGGEIEKCSSETRKNELRRMEDACRHISYNAPRNLYEALQLLWFITLVFMKVAGCGVLDYGRMDQYLYPFFKADIEKGILTRKEALNLIIEFFYKNNEIMAPTDHMSQENEAVLYSLEVAYDDPNYIIIGGLLEGHKPGVNEVSHLFIEAAHALKLRNPFVVVRYYDGIEDAFWYKVCDAMRDNATIVIYNDMTMIEALQKYGIEKSDAYEYGFYGCNDPHIAGKQSGLRQLWFNLALPLVLALNEGKNPLSQDNNQESNESLYTLEDRMIGLMTQSYSGTKTMPVKEMKSMDDLLNAYRMQVRFLLEKYREAIEKDFAMEKKWNKGRIRIEDCFLEGTIEDQITWNDGGTKYHHIIAQASGLATVVDSAAAVKKLVFDEKSITLEELVDTLNNNYQNNPNLQMKLKNKSEKFGNDIEWVDAFAVQIVNIYCDEIERVNKKEYTYSLIPTLSSDRAFTTMGEIIDATPDGRGKCDIISENQSPSLGADQNGLTALLNSVSKIPFNRITGGPLNIRIHPSAVKGEKGLEVLQAAFKTFFEDRGLQVQINVVSKEDLLEAQKRPEKYKNLCVRVTGYSAYFVQMGKKAQDELISRTEMH
ncbi:MAG: glycyl radical protein [Clostridia bacterium]|nr:glycyl radical protein [Clostridia bacterium]